MSKLSDLLLSSGFANPYATDDDERTMQALHDAILDALFNGGVLPEETIEKLLGDPADGDQEGMRSKLEELIQQIIEKMGEEGYISMPPDLEQERERRQGRGGGQGPDQPPTTFEVTDKTLDFLGYRALRDLLGSLGKSSYGRHDTREQATGVETTGAPKPYEFGDTLNLDPASTLLNAVQRESRAAHRGRAAGVAPHQRDARRPHGRAGRISEFVRHGADARLQPQHDSVRRGSVHAGQAGRARAGPVDQEPVSRATRSTWCSSTIRPRRFRCPSWAACGSVPYYTNTREGLRLSRRILDRQRKDMRQIIMITDGKPSALTQPDGRIYKNAFGLDPFVVTETLRRSGRVPKEQHHDQHLHAGTRLRPGELRPPCRRHLQGQGVLHDAVHPRSVRADGLHGQEDEDDPLNSQSQLLIANC